MSCSLPGQVKMLSSIQQELWCLRGPRQICFQTCWFFFFFLGNEVQQMQFQTADVRWLKQTGMRHWNIFSSDCRSVLVWLLVCIYINLVCLHWRLEQLPINLLSEQIQHVVLCQYLLSPCGVFMPLVSAQLQTQSLSVLKAELQTRSFGDLQLELSKNELQSPDSHLTCLR